jgi:DNA excision repair protein ERCC-3
MFTADTRSSAVKSGKSSKTSTPGPGTPQSIGSSDDYSGEEASEKEAEFIESKSIVSKTT